MQGIENPTVEHAQKRRILLHPLVRYTHMPAVVAQINENSSLLHARLLGQPETRDSTDLRGFQRT
jgi:hypothetical protein